jgi:sugar phosphate permease
MVFGTDSQARFRRLRWQVLLSTWLAYAGLYLTRKVFSVTKGPLRDALHCGDDGVAWLFMLFLVAYAAGQFLTVPMGQRWSVRQQVLGGMMVSAGCTLAIPLCAAMGPRGYYPMALLMSIHGLAQATGWPGNTAMIAAWSTRSERGTLMALWGTCYQVGAVFAKAQAGFVFALLGLSWAYWQAALLLLAINGLFVLFGHLSPEHCGLSLPDEDQPAATPPPSDAEAGPLPSQPQLAEQTARRLNRFLLAMGSLYFSFKFLRYALDSWVPLIVSDHFGRSTDVAAYVSTAYDWLGFLGVLCAGVLSDRVFQAKRSPVMFLLTGLCLVAVIMLWWIGLHSLLAFTVLLGMIGFTSMGPDSLLSGAGAMDAGGRAQAARAVAIVNGLGSIGPIVQEPLIGYLKQRAGVGAVLQLLIAITVIATAGTGSLWFISRRRGLTV